MSTAVNWKPITPVAASQSLIRPLGKHKQTSSRFMLAPSHQCTRLRLMLCQGKNYSLKAARNWNEKCIVNLRLQAASKCLSVGEGGVCSRAVQDMQEATCLAAGNKCAFHWFRRPRCAHLKLKVAYVLSSMYLTSIAMVRTCRYRCQHSRLSALSVWSMLQL